jgi:hypothetical protein
MHVLRHAHEVSAFMETHTDHDTTALIQQCMEELIAGDDTSMEELVFFVVLQEQDTLGDLENALSAKKSQGAMPWEVIEEHEACYELVYVLSSSGYGALVIAPKTDTHPEILALCRQHAIHASP